MSNGASNTPNDHDKCQQEIQKGGTVVHVTYYEDENLKVNVYSNQQLVDDYYKH